MKTTQLLFLSLLLTSCLQSVSLDMFPSSKNQIDYSEIKSRQAERNSNLKYGSKQEFHIHDFYNRSEKILVKIISDWLKKEGFTLKQSNIDEDFLIFEKGLSPEAWKSMVGVYYDLNKNTNEVEIYILYQMSQDVTGSLNINYAELIGKRIQYTLNILNKN